MVDGLGPFDGKKLVLFDLDGTLRLLRPTRLAKLFECGAALGITFSAGQRRAAVRWGHQYWADRNQVVRDKSRFDQEAFVEHHVQGYLEAIAVDGAQAHLIPEVMALFQQTYAPEPYLAGGAKALLWGLREAGLTIGLVSNRREPLTGLAIELGIIEYLHFTLAAGQVSSWKPDAGIFEHALNMAGQIPSHEAVYIGDNYYTDTIGARNAGLSAVLVDEDDAFAEVRAECLIVAHLNDLHQHIPSAKK